MSFSSDSLSTVPSSPTVICTPFILLLDTVSVIRFYAPLSFLSSGFALIVHIDTFYLERSGD